MAKKKDNSLLWILLALLGALGLSRRARADNGNGGNGNQPRAIIGNPADPNEQLDCDAVNFERFDVGQGLTEAVIRVPITNRGTANGTLWVAIRREQDAPNEWIHFLEFANVDINEEVIGALRLIYNRQESILIEAGHIEEGFRIVKDNNCSFIVIPLAPQLPQELARGFLTEARRLECRPTWSYRFAGHNIGAGAGTLWVDIKGAGGVLLWTRDFENIQINGDIGGLSQCEPFADVTIYVGHYENGNKITDHWLNAEPQ